VIRFSIFGIPVTVQPFFWITLCLLGGALHAADPEAFLQLGLFVIAGFISILVHELGHAMTARKFGANTEIVLQAFGGYAAYAGVRMTRVRSFLITAAGPGVQIVLGLAVLLVLRNFAMPNERIAGFMGDLMAISLFWAVLNLLPVLPLDGGQMLHAILGPQRIKITLVVTMITAVAVGILMFTKTQSIVFPIFMGMFAWQAFQALRDGSFR
jgi:Zn-dependent protease